MSFDLQAAIEASVLTNGIVFLPYGQTVLSSIPTVDHDVTIQGASITGSQLVCPGIHVTTRGSVNFRDFRLTGPGSGEGILFDYAFHSKVRGCLIEGFDAPIWMQAGNSWSVTGNYLLGKKFGCIVQNVENADEGDGEIVGNVFDSSTGIAAIHYINSGGLRVLRNKVLGHQFGLLGEFEGATSDLLFNSNSVENQSQVGVALRTQTGGSFSNVVITGNQFAGMTNAITANGVNRGVVDGNVFNITGHPFQSANASGWNLGTNS